MGVAQRGTGVLISRFQFDPPRNLGAAGLEQ
jgi:hypothetical protein